MREFRVRAANFYATYNAGKYMAENAVDAIEQAKQEMRKFNMNPGEYKFFIVDKFPHERGE